MNEAERLAAIAEARPWCMAISSVCRKDCSWFELLNASRAELARRFWLLARIAGRVPVSLRVLSVSAGQSIALEGSRLTACLRDGAVFHCADAKSDPRTRFDALPGVADGSVLAVLFHFEGRVAGALEVTFAQAWGFEDADVRTCQILSGLVSETCWR